MNRLEIIPIRDHAELLRPAAQWFHQKWGIPLSAYLDSMESCLKNSSAVPQWYVVLDGTAIVAGLGVIENDFHNRPDLTPNVCAVYVEEEYRNRGIAGQMLQFVCADCSAQGIDTLYLVTSHTSFYERYGWEYFCPIRCDGEADTSRMYIHRTSQP